MMKLVRRIRQTLVHMLFERRFNIDTEDCEHLEDYGVSGENGDRVPYVPSGWLDFGKMARLAKFKKGDVFVDFGSGKGRMVFLAAANHAFRRVIGVELLNEWNETARQNIDKNRHRLKCKDVALVTSDVLEYEICNSAGCARAFVEINVVCNEIRPLTGMSPNGDGLNDTWIIDGLEDFPDHVIRLYNRWGTGVLEAKNYKNDWGGTWNGALLPDGTYFYLIENGEGKTISGYLQLQR